MSVTKKFLKDSMTGKDNETYDAIRILSVLSIVIALGLTVYVVVWKDKPFNIQDYGIGLGLIFAAVGAALKLKESTEPNHVSETTTQITKVTSNALVQTKDVTKE